MVKLSNYFLRMFTVVGILFLYSCGGDDPVEVAVPTITVGGSDFDDMNSYTGVPGSEISAIISIATEGGFNTLRVTKSGGQPQDEFVESKEPGQEAPKEWTYTFKYTLVEEEVGETVKFTIQAVDEAGKTTTVTLTVITSSPEARVFSKVLLAAPLGDKSAKTFFSTDTGETYSPNDVTGTSASISPNIDFGYYEGSTSGANLASPSSFASNSLLSSQVTSWSVKNDITFKTTTLTSAQFTELKTFADIDKAFKEGTATTDPLKVSGLKVDDVVAFETDKDKVEVGGKKGLIKVVSITPGTGTAGKIELEILFQLPAK